MVTRSFQVRHNDSDFSVVYDTDDGLEVLKYQLFSLTSVPPDEQKIIGADDDRVVSEDSDLAAVPEKLRLVSISDEGTESDALNVEFLKSDEELARMLQIIGADDDRVVSEDSDLAAVPEKLRLVSISDEGTESDALNVEFLKSDEELARMLQEEEEALMYQQFTVREGNGAFEGTVRPYISQVLLYEDPIRQEAARKTVSVEQLEEKALVSLAKEGNFTPSKKEQDHAFLLQLLFWFKQSFSWVNQPPCDSCGQKTVSLGMDAALPPELLYGASQVEIYRCTSCPTVTRFPRYNDPLKLLETRRGRCGEWANCFTLYCRAFGYESRLILDFTDHVWTECFSESLGRWMHLDPCDGVYDKPLLYESGWNKKLDYVIAIGKDGACDVTKRYTRKWPEVLSRRNIIAEPTLSSVLSNITKECRRGLASQVQKALEDRDEKERQELERDLHSTDDASTSLPGRRSGDKEWRKSRMEDGSDESFSITGSSCPLRQCVDEHVTKIYNGFLPILSQLVDEGFSKPRAVEVLEILKGILINLKKSPFKTRRVSIDSVPNINQSVVRQLLPSFTELLSALSLSSKADTDGRINISLAGPAVKTSLALPVTFHALDVTIRNLKSCENFVKDSLCLPLLKLNRIHSGGVHSSGEEIPFGIATSAFDGTRVSKWEEPNGAKGCWIIYKVSDNQMHELVAYELMSANDAPERDPMDWVLEGSNDGGSSWCPLDKRTSQLFDSRFQCRTFKVSSEGFLSNAFRFRFLKVRDIQSNSRLQLGSIDLFSRIS